MTLSFLAAIGAMACLWLVPDDYDMGAVMSLALDFFDIQRTGKIPMAGNKIWWQASSFTYDNATFLVSLLHPQSLCCIQATFHQSPYNRCCVSPW